MRAEMFIQLDFMVVTFKGVLISHQNNPSAYYSFKLIFLKTRSIYNAARMKGHNFGKLIYKLSNWLIDFEISYYLYSWNVQILDWMSDDCIIMFNGPGNRYVYEMIFSRLKTFLLKWNKSLEKNFNAFINLYCKCP